MPEFYRPTHETYEEREPSLPEDPAEVAAQLQETWKRSGGWKSQDPLQEKSVSGFRWLADMNGSDAYWMNSYCKTNKAEIIGFRFGYDIPENPDEDVPNAYIYRPLNNTEPAMYVSKNGNGWEMRPLKDVHQDYIKMMEY